MIRTPITPNLDDFPAVYHELLAKGTVYDSSCSRIARVVLIDHDGGDRGYYLKRAPRGMLSREVEMTRYFHSLGLATAVLDARQEGEFDWLLTARVPGEDATHAQYLSEPKRLCDLWAERLRALHELPTLSCPAPTHTETYLRTVETNYQSGNYDATLFPDNWGYDSAEAAIAIVRAEGQYLASDTLLHGDYCLPNIMLDNWRFSGFIDLDHAGVGDRHVDLFWGAWSLNFNLKTDAYRDRFFDAYGRDVINQDIFRVVAACEVFG